MSHTTTQPTQTQTDTFQVMRSMSHRPNVELLGHVEVTGSDEHSESRPVRRATVAVPRYSQPDQNGVRLDRDTRLSLAVSRVIEREDTFIESPYYPGVEVLPTEYSVLDGETFWVSTELGDYEPVEYEHNPSGSAMGADQ